MSQPRFMTPLDFLMEYFRGNPSTGACVKSTLGNKKHFPIDMTISFLINIFTANSNVTRASALYMYLSAVINYGAFVMATARYHIVLDHLLWFLTTLQPHDRERYRETEPFIPISGEPRKKFEPVDIFDMFDKALESPNEVFSLLSWYNLKKIVTYLVFFQYVPDSVLPCAKFFSLYDSKYGDDLKNNGNNIDTIVSVLKSVNSLARVAYSGKLDYTESTDPLKFVQDVEWLRHYRYMCCNPDDLGLPQHQGFISSVEWTDKCHDTYKRRLLLDIKGMSACVKTLVHHAIKHLDALYDSSFNIAGGKRPPPLVVGLTGDSGSGKTTFIAPHFSQIIQQSLGYSCPNVNSGFQIINGADPFLASYDQNRDHVVLFDELGAYKNSDKNTNNIITNSFLEMCTAGKFILNSAHLEEKGKREWRPRAIFVASNREDFGLPEIVNCPVAGYNRFTVVFHVSIKDKYKKLDEKGNNIGGIDLHKLNAERSRLTAEFGDKASQKSDYWPVLFYQKNKELNGFSIDWNKPLEFLEACDSMKQCAFEHRKLVENHTKISTANVEAYNCTNCNKFSCTCEPMVRTSGSYSMSPELFSSPSTIYLLHLFMCALFYDFLVACFRWLPYSEHTLLWVTKRKMKLEMEHNAARILLKCRRSSKNLKSEIDRIVSNDTLGYVLTKTMFGFKIIALLLTSYLALKKSGLIDKIVPKKKEEEYQSTAGYNSIARSTLQPNNPHGRIPSKILVNQNNIWSTPNVNKLIFGKACCTPFDVIIEKIKWNTLFVSFSEAGSEDEMFTHIFNFHDTFYLVTTHWFTDARNIKNPKINIYRPLIKEDSSGTTVCYTHKVMQLDYNPKMVYHLDNDLSILNIPQLQPGKSLLDCFIKDLGDYKYVDGYNAVIHPTKHVNYVDKVEGKLQIVKYDNGNDQQLEYPAFVCKSTLPSFKGRCGSPLFTKIGSQTAIVGICAAGKVNSQINAFSPITKPILQLAIEHFKSPILNSVSSTSFDEAYNTKDLELTPTSGINQSYWLKVEDVGTIRVFGSSPDIPVQRPKSKVFKLKIFDSFFNKFDKEYHHNLVVPNFKSYTYEGEYYGVYSNMLDQLKEQTHNVNLDHLEAVVSHLTQKFGSIEDFDNLEFWDMDHACSGANYNPFCKPLPKATAAGWPLNGKKVDWTIPSTSKYSEGVIPNDELRKRILEQIELMSQGIRPMTVYKTCMKDEPRDRDKNRERKIRVFTCAPMDQAIIQKMFLGNFTGIFTRNFLETETVGGMNCYGPDWGKVYEKLSQHPNVINGDYSKYDKRVSTIMINSAFSVCYNIIDSRLKLTDKQRMLFRTMMTEVSNPVLLMEKEFLTVNGSLSSGVYLTFLLNNIMNSIFIRLAWLSITNAQDYKASLELFDANVVFFAMGDDNTFSVSDSYISLFNFRSIQSYFASIGMKYTNAEKTDDIYGSVPVNQATICKRTWRFDPEFNYYFCPIEKPSIGKMMTMALNEGPLTEDQKIQASFISAMYEFVQYGRYEYNNCINILVEVLKENGIKPPKVFSFEEMVKKQIDDEEVPWDIKILDDFDVSSIQRMTSTGARSVNICPGEVL
ncbi:hypothetical protein 1 [Wenzhou picorna-like virus 20]|uniref:hypothetical protein 1 n=1 Tax=Wenzhou picorna-like virus 20 TaxID=1923605 RepID=UPI0009095D1C|nr:hypothetical protein 1 [Wenzhou picorna-like virus 20]APG78550.1 hypothetical protein 1 [Wenzhou picorna-like virus 20]